MTAAQRGFTIIELITVVSITAIISVVSVAVLINSQVRGTRATTINKVRTEGSFLLDRIGFQLRNARYLEANQHGEVCQSAMDAIRVRSADGGIVELYRTEDNRVASNSGTILQDPPSAYLTSPDIQVDTLIFSCQQTADQGGAIVGVDITLSTGSSAALSPESYYQESFATQVYVRSYQ